MRLLLVLVVAMGQCAGRDTHGGVLFATPWIPAAGTKRSSKGCGKIGQTRFLSSFPDRGHSQGRLTRIPRPGCQMQLDAFAAGHNIIAAAADHAVSGLWASGMA